jgi:hypothetical protein
MGLGNEIDRLDRPVKPADNPSALFRLNSEVVGKDALRPHSCIVAIHREFSNRLTSQIRRRFDPAIDINIDRGVTETANRKYGDGKERRVIKIHRSQKVG